MKIWVDDIRTPPDDSWYWLLTSSKAIAVLMARRTVGLPVEVMSLDHDLGGLDTTRPVVLWCCENDFWPDEVRVHTANPVGCEWLTGMIERYKS
jgi:hypothetical protein